MVSRAAKSSIRWICRRFDNRSHHDQLPNTIIKLRMRDLLSFPGWERSPAHIPDLGPEEQIVGGLCEHACDFPMKHNALSDGFLRATADCFRR